MVLSCEILAKALLQEGKYVQYSPDFSAERRGAPVLAFDRISTKKPIRIRAGITEPDVVIVLDPTLIGIVDVTSGLKEKGILILNTKKSLQDIQSKFGNKWRLAVVDATRIARELLGVPIVNTTMLGALLRATGVVKAESLFEPLSQRFRRLAEGNIKAMQKAFDDTAVKE